MSTLQRHMSSCHPTGMERVVCRPAKDPMAEEVPCTIARLVATGSQSVPKVLSLPSFPPVVPEEIAFEREVGDTAVLSLSPTPMSPLQKLSVSPRAVVPPYEHRGGKPRGMMQMMQEKAESPAASSSPSSLPSLEGPDDDVALEAAPAEEVPPPLKRMKMATVKKYTSSQTFLDGALVSNEQQTRIFLKLIEVDEEGRPLGSE